MKNDKVNFIILDLTKNIFMKIESIELNKDTRVFESVFDDETYGLIHLEKFRNMNHVQLIKQRQGNASYDTFSVKCETFIGVNMVGYYKLKIETNLINEDVIVGTFFKGTMAEMMLQEIRLTLDRHYQIYNRPDVVSFRIGLKESSNIIVSPDPDDKYYRLIISIDGEPKVQQQIEINSESGNLVRYIYDRVRDNCANKDRVKYQEDNANQLQKNTENAIKR